MENLKALAYELRENVIDMIVEGKPDISAET